MKYFLIALLLTLYVNAKPIRFAPLPMDIAPKLHMQYSSMLSYLEKETGLSFEFVYCANYAEMLQRLQNKEIDIAELGPLPYIQLAEAMPQVKPFLTFLTQDGADSYTCKLFTTDDDVNTLEDIKEKQKHLFLTSKHSTCGPLMMQEILHGIGKDLDDFNKTFAQTHSNVLLKNMLTPNAIGGIKSTVFANYAHIGLKTLATSEKIPGFAFAANSELLTEKEISAIQNAILKLQPLTNETDWHVTKKWGKNIRFGAVKPEADAYKNVKDAWEKMNNDK